MADTMTVLVTGASGLVGAEVTARLTAAGHRVLALMHSNGDIVRNNGRALPAAPPDRAGSPVTSPAPDSAWTARSCARPRRLTASCPAPPSPTSGCPSSATRT
ncbi:NAD-dependent epimerase/dehydratase family protein [Streptomyces sp. LN325]|uniref:NAD-dependent epimerase/dehydratase family protein n=1 Tax=Streptomyces sp. LN325 TaxID=3112976 RepID=UPI00371AB3EC